VNPGHRVHGEAPPPQQGWWTRLRRGISGHPRSAVEV
jgi:hypothetical protein